jgi:cyanate lyase
MKRSDLTEKLLDLKRERGWSWKHIRAKIGGHSECWWSAPSSAR